MSRVRTLLSGQLRHILLVASAAALFALWFGLWLRVLPPDPRGTIYIGEKGKITAVSNDGNLVMIDRPDGANDDPGLFICERGAASPQPLLPEIPPTNVIYVNLEQRTAVVAEYKNPGPHELSVVEIPNGKTLRSMKIEEFPDPLHVSFSMDGRWMAQGIFAHYDQGRVDVIDLQAMAKPWILNHQDHEPVAFSFDSKWLATHGRGSWEGRTITVWDLATGEPVTRIHFEDWAYSLAFSRNSQVLIARGQIRGDGEPFGYEGIAAWEMPSGVLRKKVTPWRGHSEVSGDGKRILGTAIVLRPSLDSLVLELSLWDVNTPWESGVIEMAHKSSAEDLDVVGSVAGNRLLAVRQHISDDEGHRPWLSKLTAPRADGLLRLFDIERLNFLPALPIQGEPCFSRDGFVMAVHSGADKAAIYDVPPRRSFAVPATLGALPAILLTLLLWWRLVH